MRTAARLLLGCVLLALAVPMHAEVFTVKLTNGATFESRYQPKQASWDPNVVVLLDETGLAVALPKEIVSSITSQTEMKGFGRVIDTTTIDLGYAPNDMPVQQQQANNAQLLMDYMNHHNSYDQNQFVEPSAVGGGIPVWTAGAAGNSVPSVSVFNTNGAMQTPAAPMQQQNNAPTVVAPQSPPQQ